MSTQGLTKELDVVRGQRAKWEREHRRFAVPALDDVRSYSLALGRMSAVRGGARVETSTDILPVFTVRGMPASEYPRYVTYLVGYTLAAAAAEDPVLAPVVWSQTWCCMATVVVSARVGVWAATGHVPEEESTRYSSSLRWSASLGKLVSRAHADCPDMALFKYFLRQSPDGSSAMHRAAMSMMWVAPPMLLVAAHRAVRGVDSFTSNILEGVVKRYVREEKLAEPYLDVYSTAVWDAFRSAATGAYGADRLAALAADPAYAASAQLRVAAEGATQLKLQLEDALAAQVGQGESDLSGSDCDSVADTEAGSPVVQHIRPAKVMSVIDEASEDTMAIPPPPLDAKAHEELVAAIRNTKPMTPAFQSLARMPQAMETAIDF